MKKICEICGEKYESNSNTRLYCYNCSGESNRNNSEGRKHQKTILRRSIFHSFICLLMNFFI